MAKSKKPTKKTTKLTGRKRPVKAPKTSVPKPGPFVGEEVDPLRPECPLPDCSKGCELPNCLAKELEGEQRPPFSGGAKPPTSTPRIGKPSSRQTESADLENKFLSIPDTSPPSSPAVAVAGRVELGGKRPKLGVMAKLAVASPIEELIYVR